MKGEKYQSKINWQHEVVCQQNVPHWNNLKGEKYQSKINWQHEVVCQQKVPQFEDVPLVEFIYLVLYACHLRVTVGNSGLCCRVLCDVFRALINSLVYCWNYSYICLVAE